MPDSELNFITTYLESGVTAIQRSYHTLYQTRPHTRFHTTPHTMPHVMAHISIGNILNANINTLLRYGTF